MPHISHSNPIHFIKCFKNEALFNPRITLKHSLDISPPIDS